jgi:hypothetical protein
MVFGVTNPTVSARSVHEHYSVLRSYIMSFFDSTEAQPEYKSNKVWQDPINGDANGAFRVYYQNVHGIPRDDVSLSQDLQALAEYDVGCFLFVGNQSRLAPPLRPIGLPRKAMKDMATFCYFLFLNRHGVLFRLYDWRNSYVHGGPVELPCFQEGFGSIRPGLLELPNSGRKTKYQGHNHYWLLMCAQHK